MRGEPRRAFGSNAPRSETTIRLPSREHELSTTLNRLIGEANCEVALLPTRTTIDEWTNAEIHDAVIRCQRSVIDALSCAVELQSLDELDAYSMTWIDETRQACQRHVDALARLGGEHGAMTLKDG